MMFARLSNTRLHSEWILHSRISFEEQQGNLHLSDGTISERMSVIITPGRFDRIYFLILKISSGRNLSLSQISLMILIVFFLDPL